LVAPPTAATYCKERNSRERMTMTRKCRTALFSAAAVMLLAGGIVIAADVPPAMTSPVNTLLAQGYLAREALPDSLAILPAPPTEGSAALARDREASKAALALGKGARWDLATADADLRTPAATGAFSCAAGFEISPQATPAIDRLMRRSLPDLGLATYGVKERYKRARPFMENGEANCSPDYTEMLRKDGSYPSGHSAIGFGWGLMLAEIVPDRSARLVARGIAFGDSRRICNLHWLSDVEQGRLMGAAVVARLRADPRFQADLQAAKAEAIAARSTAPSRNCAQEDAALAQKP
jgi:acid phosphatase (class A)